MQARLSSVAYRALRRLRTRHIDDFSVALLDAWATVADVLAFYQERIATEAFLRTATERRSVLELARLVGYSPRPGVAASVHLAFTVDLGYVTRLPRGTRVQSVPGPGELPQTFETSEDLEARAELNVLRPRLQRPQYLTLDRLAASPLMYLDGVDANLKVNDWLLVAFRGLATARALFQVVEVKADAAQDRTELKIIRRDPPVDADGGPSTGPSLAERIRALALRYKAASTFGVPPNAAKLGLNVLSALEADIPPSQLVERARKETLPALQDLYTAAVDRGASRVAAWLQRAILDLQAILRDSTPATPGLGDKTRVPPLKQVVAALGKPASLQPRSARRLERNAVALYGEQSDLIPRLFGVLFPNVPAAAYTVLGQVGVQEQSPLESVDVLRVKAALFGHNLPKEVAFDSNGKPVVGGEPNLYSILGARQPVDKIPLDAVYERIKAGSRVVIHRPVISSDASAAVTWTFSYHEVTSVDTLTLRAHGVSSRVTLLGVTPKWPSGDVNTSFFTFPAALRSTTVLAQNEPLPLAQEPIAADLTGDEEYLELDGLYRGLEAGRFVIVEGERTDLLPAALRPPEMKAETSSGAVDAELAMISEVVHRMAKAPGTDADLPGDTLHTFIRFASGLAFRFKRETARIFANVVAATHGETKEEVLGHGDATRAFQTFPLKQPPLTYVAAPTARGAESTLEVRVNEVLWHEAAHFAGLAPNDRRYTIRIDDEGGTAVIFGNGRQGARLPTGLENVRARYRSGIGKAGNVAARQISLLLSKPLGLKEVVNPMRAAGGADRESRDQARRNAPKGAKALDRLVSVQDYADFAEAFAGIGKAAAAELSDGRRSAVHVTIAGADDIAIAVTSDLFENLLRALQDLGDPHQPLELAVRELLVLVVQARVRVLPDFSFELIEPKLRRAMLEAFGFERRALAQDVLQAEVLSVLQGVPGVAYVDLDVLAAVGEEDLASAGLPAKLGLAQRIRVRGARLRGSARVKGQAAVAPAQLAILSPEVPDTLILSELR
jgi:hypothetical protein